MIMATRQTRTYKERPADKRTQDVLSALDAAVRDAYKVTDGKAVSGRVQRLLDRLDGDDYLTRF